MDYTETTIKSENIYDGKIINLRVDSVELPNRKYSKREVVVHGDVAAIIAIRNNKIVLLKHFRKPVEEILIEIPAGGVMKGETPGKDKAQYRPDKKRYQCSHFTY